jgi:hypothetical protein
MFKKFMIHTGNSGPSTSSIYVNMKEETAYVETFGNTGGDSGPIYLLRTQDRFKWDILNIYENVG